MADFISADLGIATDELFSPDYVRFDCKVWQGLPDNTMGGKGWHVVYRPLCSGPAWDALYAPNPAPAYRGTEVVTDEMRTAVRTHYAREKAIAAAQAAEQHEASVAESAAIIAAAEVLAAIPTAPAEEMAGAVRRHHSYWTTMNEGGEGYAPPIGWDTTEGRTIAQRYGLDVEQLAAAERALRGA